jgi:predicted phosphate transport protein (TIGR00153 family)
LSPIFISIQSGLLTSEDLSVATSNPLAGLFGRNPFDALQQHMSAVTETVEHVPSLFRALADKDKKAVKRIKNAICESEARADKVKNKLREHLPKRLFLPVDRRDLLEMLDLQDSIADVTQDIAELLVERKMEIPPDMEEPLLKLVDSCVDVCREAAGLISELDELLALGFGGQEAERVEERVNALNLSEDETDKLEAALTKQLFAIEDQLPPVSVIFWYRLIEWIGDIADYSEKVGNRLRLLIAR